METEPSLLWFFFSPSGRISRAPFGMGIAFWTVLICAAITHLVSSHQSGSTGALVGSFLALVILCLASTVSMAMLTIKRVHDIGHPAVVAFVIFVPAISLVALGFFLLLASGPPNVYGYQPNRPR